MTDRKYGRNDVIYDEFYSSWMKSLASSYSKIELEIMLYGAKSKARESAKCHARAIERTSSMTGNSMSRAHARNSTAAAGDAAIAINGAIEIHELFPEHANK